MQHFLSTFYLRHYGPTIHTPVATQSVNENRGLDPMIIQSFPTFTYSSVKEYRKDKFGLECAICLLEFEDIDVLRLMTICCHVFHQECIDPWLASHKTCPACRRVLDVAPVSKTPPNCSPLDTNHSVMHESINEDDELSMPDQISITVKDDDDFHDQEEKAKSPACDKNTCFCAYQKFSRSNSTGHSIAKKETVVEEDKFTLKLPEHVKKNSSTNLKIFHHHRELTTVTVLFKGDFDNNAV
ncbi:hypothetical protein Leryth_010538 [Lithospermum erythrorhizon]|nr:hypothetical protein Leryth_010538 [Lithospermum erythrorhizon]